VSYQIAKALPVVILEGPLFTAVALGVMGVFLIEVATWVREIVGQLWQGRDSERTFIEVMMHFAVRVFCLFELLFMIAYWVLPNGQDWHWRDAMQLSPITKVADQDSYFGLPFVLILLATLGLIAGVVDFCRRWLDPRSSIEIKLRTTSIAIALAIFDLLLVANQLT
jgi:hypothetical protein